jgi:hypothetical protein
MNLAKGPRHYKPFQRQPDAISQHLMKKNNKKMAFYFFLQR